MRKHRKSNPEATRRVRRRYYINNSESIKENQRQFRVNNLKKVRVQERNAYRKRWEENPDKMRRIKQKNDRKYKERHPEKYRETSRRCTRNWASKNKNRVRQKNREWRKNNPKNVQELRQRRRARKFNATVGYTLTLEEMLEEQDGCCFYCGRREGEITPHGNDYIFTKEHVIPLARGGDHAWWNLVAACHQCNSSKKDKLLDEWEVPDYD